MILMHKSDGDSGEVRQSVEETVVTSGVPRAASDDAPDSSVCCDSRQRGVGSGSDDSVSHQSPVTQTTCDSDVHECLSV